MGNLRTDQLIDQVDDQDTPVGVLNRRDIVSQRANFRVVHIFVFDRHHNLLLQAIAQGQRSAGLYGSSVAGYVNAGESYSAAAMRKLNSELGVSAPITMLGKTVMTDLSTRKFITLFSASHDGPFTLDSQQVSAVHFRSLSNIAGELQSWPEKYTETFRHLFAFHAARTRP